MKDLKIKWINLKKENKNCISFNNFVAHSLTIQCSIERLFLPVFIENKKVQFTNIVFNCNASGKDYFLISIDEKYYFLEYAYEPDCDGAYYTHYIVDLFDVRNDYTLNEVYTDTILKMLKTY